MSDHGFTLPQKYYTSVDVFIRELNLVLGQMWFCIGRAEEVAHVGDYVLREIADESFIVTRESPERINAFYNVCRHRGTRLCDSPKGRSLRLQCPYHAWTYDLTGKLIAAPHFEENEDFHKSSYSLRPVACDTWDGHVFLNLAPNPTPLHDQLGDLPNKFAPWDMGSLRQGARIVYDVAANWKLIVQNYSECLHCPVIHPALQKVSHYLSGHNEPGGADWNYLGGRMDLREGIATMSRDGVALRKNLPGLSEDDCRHVYYYAVLPNLLLSLHPDYMMTHLLRPISAGRTEVVCEWHFTPAEMAKSGFDPTDAVEFWDLTNRQDWHVSELTQLGLRSRSYAPGPYSAREELLHAFDMWIIAKLGDRLDS